MTGPMTIDRRRFGLLGLAAGFAATSAGAQEPWRQLSPSKEVVFPDLNALAYGPKVGIRFEGQSALVIGTCVELSVGGMTIRSAHVPCMDEIFEIAVLPPEPGGVYQPLHARVQVRRCHGLAQAGLYEMGVEIVEIIK
mgnify:CR=1 FL=1